MAMAEPMWFRIFRCHHQVSKEILRNNRRITGVHRVAVAVVSSIIAINMRELPKFVNTCWKLAKSISLIPLQFYIQGYGGNGNEGYGQQQGGYGQQGGYDNQGSGNNSGGGAGGNPGRGSYGQQGGGAPRSNFRGNSRDGSSGGGGNSGGGSSYGGGRKLEEITAQNITLL